MNLLQICMLRIGFIFPLSNKSHPHNIFFISKLLIRQGKTMKSLITKNRQSIWDLLHLKKAHY
jgi:hypothetical protein